MHELDLRNADSPRRQPMPTAAAAARQQLRELGITTDLTTAADILGIGRTRAYRQANAGTLSRRRGAHRPQLPRRRRADHRLPRPARRASWLSLPLCPKRSVHKRVHSRPLRIAEGANPLYPKKKASCRCGRRRAAVNDPVNQLPVLSDVKKILRLLPDTKVLACVFVAVAHRPAKVRRSAAEFSLPDGLADVVKEYLAGAEADETPLCFGKKLPPWSATGKDSDAAKPGFCAVAGWSPHRPRPTDLARLCRPDSEPREHAEPAAPRSGAWRCSGTDLRSCGGEVR